MRSVADGRHTELECDDVLIQIGFEADSSLFEALGASLEGDSRQVEHDPSTMETSIPGLYVAGTAVAGTQARFRVYIENSTSTPHGGSPLL